MKQEQFAGMRARLMEQLQQGVEWSDEAILERIDQLVSEAARENRLPVSRREEIGENCFIRCENWIFCRNCWMMTG